MTQNSDNPKHYQGYDISGPQTRRLWRIYDLCEVSKGLGGYGGMGGLNHGSTQAKRIDKRDKNHRI